jgi:hypothetical protein
MAIFSDFDIANDVKVEMLLPQDVNNVFVLGISLLDGTDVLGDDSAGTLAWQNLACEINRVQTSIGGSIASNVFYQANAGTATMQMQSWEFDPANYSYIRPSTPVRIRIARGGYSFILWTGFVDNIDVTYAPDQPNQITIQATDIWALAVNRRMDYEPDPYVIDDFILPSEALAAACDIVSQAPDFAINYDGSFGTFQPAMSLTAVNNTTFGSVVSNALNTGLGFIYFDPNEDALIYRPRSVSGTPVYTVGNNHGEVNHLCMADLTMATKSEDIYNNVLVTQRYEVAPDPLFEILYRNQDSIDLYGERSDDFTVDLNSVADAAKWADLVFTDKPVTIVEQVVTPAVNRLGDLTEAVEFMPADFVGVYYVTDEMNVNTSYTVTKVSHSIDVNNWFTTLDVWKEF